MNFSRKFESVYHISASSPDMSMHLASVDASLASHAVNHAINRGTWDNVNVAQRLASRKQPLNSNTPTNTTDGRYRRVLHFRM